MESYNILNFRCSIRNVNVQPLSCNSKLVSIRKRWPRFASVSAPYGVWYSLKSNFWTPDTGPVIYRYRVWKPVHLAEFQSRVNFIWKLLKNLRLASWKDFVSCWCMNGSETYARFIDFILWNLHNCDFSYLHNCYVNILIILQEHMHLNARTTRTYVFFRFVRARCIIVHVSIIAFFSFQRVCQLVMFAFKSRALASILVIKSLIISKIQFI